MNLAEIPNLLKLDFTRRRFMYILGYFISVTEEINNPVFHGLKILQENETLR
jgi:hypothetical protein